MPQPSLVAIVGSLDEAHHVLAQGADEVVFAVTVSRSLYLEGERIPNVAAIPLDEWGRRVVSGGAGVHVQIRDAAPGGHLAREAISSLPHLAEAGFTECWIGDPALLAGLRRHAGDIRLVADWRLPLTNAASCLAAQALGADGLCVAPPFPRLDPACNPAYLLVQGQPSLDPRTDAQPEFFTAPLILSELEWLSFTYTVRPQDFTSVMNRGLRTLEGEWRTMVCPHAHIEAQHREWRGWGCAACSPPSTPAKGPLRAVIELLDSPAAWTSALRAARGWPATGTGEQAHRWVSEQPDLSPEMCCTGARCRHQ